MECLVPVQSTSMSVFVCCFVLEQCVEGLFLGQTFSELLTGQQLLVKVH
jgi:hypothetical protein